MTRPMQHIFVETSAQFTRPNLEPAELHARRRALVQIRFSLKLRSFATLYRSLLLVVCI